jgi:hypothetical protein
VGTKWLSEFYADNHFMQYQNQKSKLVQAGEVFGKWTALETAQKTAQKVLCSCECGTVRQVSNGNLKSGLSKSCGCSTVASSKSRMTTHGKSRTPEHVAWNNAKARCHRKTHPRYADWGGRGIEMCERWRNSFEAFLEDMGPRPGPNYSIDRIDGNKGYEPGNCRWATSQEQSENRPDWVNAITFNGETLSMTQWAKRVGISRKSLYDRIALGWPVEKALTLPKTVRKNA